MSTHSQSPDISSYPEIDIKNVSFIVNTQKCGPGRLRCVATHKDDNSPASVECERVDTYIYKVRVRPKRTGPLHLYIDHVSTGKKAHRGPKLDEIVWSDLVSA